MKRHYLILFIAALMNFCAQATESVELASLYFEETTEAPTKYTIEKMKQMKELFSSHHIQFIEINAFADNISSFDANKSLAEKRLKYVLAYFGVEPADGVINVYGQSKQPISFKPFNWERVDIYYHIEGVPEPISNVQEDNAENIDTKEYNTNLPVPERNEIVENVPVLLNIEFISGKYEVKKGSEPKLEQLYKTLQSHQDLNVLIRGHVCCENKKGASKKRAKVVYNYLKGKGISTKRMTYKGYGNTEPVAFPERTAEDRAKNRRVDLVFSKENPGKKK